jgi:hypothetical protein
LSAQFFFDCVCYRALLLLLPLPFLLLLLLLLLFLFLFLLLLYIFHFSLTPISPSSFSASTHLRIYIQFFMSFCSVYLTLDHID